MKAFIALALVMSQAALAANRPATQKEVAFLCVAVETNLVAQESDIEVEMEKCLKGEAIVRTTRAHNTIIEGNVPTTWAGISGLDFCKVTFQGETELNNIVGGVERGVRCK